MLGLIWFLQVIAEAMALLGVWRLNMLPDQYFLILCGGFGVLALFTAILMLPKKAGGFRTGFGIFLSVVVFIISCTAAVLVIDAHGTIQQVTGHSSSDMTMAVYVRTDDPAQNIGDAADYRFAVVQGHEQERTQEAVDSIEKDLGTQISVSEYAGAQELVEAFFAGESDALILNSAYTALLEELEGYADFNSRVRVLHEVGVTVWSSVLDNLGKDEGEDTPKTETVDEITQDGFVVYISGSDTRSSKLTTTGRNDVNILAVVNPQTKQVLLLNTPRDYFVSNPASSSGAMDKLTHCGIYGIECSMQALANLYDVDVNYYAHINFTGFKTLVDAIGGITVYSDTAFTSISGEHYNKGENQLNGTEALAFARERKNLPGGDNARGENQMKVIRAVIDKVTSGTTIISNYAGIMESLEGMFATSISMNEISDLVKMQLDDMAQWNIVSYAVTGDGGSEITYSDPGRRLYVMYQNEALVSYGAELIDRVMAGEILTEADMVAPQ